MSERASDLATGLVAGDQRALARSLTLVEDGDPAGADVLARVYAHTGRARLVGVTGPPGVGKSTLIDRLVAEARAAGRTVGVLSVDPSSPFTAGALLGDRTRLHRHFGDARVFIRSMATRGAAGGLARATLQAALLLDAAGTDLVFVETVGVGQAELRVLDVVETIIVCLMPGSGDALQAIKSGIMEIPDVMVVCRGDDPAADTTVRDVREALVGRTADHLAPPLLKVDAMTGTGIDALWAAVVDHQGVLVGRRLQAHRRSALRSEIVRIVVEGAAERAHARLEASGALDRLMDEVADRRALDPLAAARRLVAELDLGTPVADAAAHTRNGALP